MRRRTTDREGRNNEYDGVISLEYGKRLLGCLRLYFRWLVDGNIGAPAVSVRIFSAINGSQGSWGGVGNSHFRAIDAVVFLIN